MRWLKFLLSHSLFVSICAAALSCQTCILLQKPIDWSFCSLIFWLTLGTYNLYWGLSKWSFEITCPKVFSNYLINIILMVVSTVALLFYLSLLFSIWPYLIIASLSTILYCLPLIYKESFVKYRKIGFIKTLLLAFTWTFVTVVFPAHSIFATNFLDILFVFSCRFLFLLTLCIIFDLRDSKIDLFHGIRSLANELSKQSVNLIMVIIFFLQLFVIIFFLKYKLENSQAIVLFTTAVLSIGCYFLSAIKERSYYFYYFLVDGLMLFSAIASYIATI